LNISIKFDGSVDLYSESWVIWGRIGDF
jgi:hypothetical protein